MTDSLLPPEIARELDGRSDADRLARTWQLVSDALPDTLPPGVPSTAEAWAEIEIKLGPERAAGTFRPQPAEDRAAVRGASTGLARWARPLAVLGALLAATVGGEAWWARQSVLTEAAAGTQRRVELDDGSSVVLNSGSRLTYARGLGATLPWRASTRRVALDGEASFDVAHDAGRPFVVQTFNADVAVLGTRFNVRAWPGERAPETRVALESGRVRVAARGARPGPAVVLAPGEATAVAAGRAAPATAVAVDRVAAWRGGGFAVERLPLGDVLAEVGRRFGTEVRVAGGVPVDLPVTLYYRDGVTAEDILHDLALAAGLRYRPFRGGFEVRPAEAQ